MLSYYYHHDLCDELLLRWTHLLWILMKQLLECSHMRADMQILWFFWKLVTVFPLFCVWFLRVIPILNCCHIANVAGAVSLDCSTECSAALVMTLSMWKDHRRANVQGKESGFDLTDWFQVILKFVLCILKLTQLLNEFGFIFFFCLTYNSVLLDLYSFLWQLSNGRIKHKDGTEKAETPW